MAYADYVFVPEPGLQNCAYGDTFDMQGDPFGLGVLNSGSQGTLLTRSVSRKRLTPEALAAVADDMVPGDGGPPLDAVDDPGIAALLLAYRSYPGVDQHPHALRAPPRLRIAARGPHSGVAARIVRCPVPCAKLGQRQTGAAQQPEPRPHEVPVLGPPHAEPALTATTAGSAFATSVTSDGHVPSSGALPAHPYSELLTGPAFSYAADGDGVFEADEISLGSLDSGSYILGADDDDCDPEESDIDSGLLRSWSASTVCSGSGERFNAALADAAAAMPTVLTLAASNELGSARSRGVLRAAAAPVVLELAVDGVSAIGIGSAAAAPAAAIGAVVLPVNADCPQSLINSNGAFLGGSDGGGGLGAVATGDRNGGTAAAVEEIGTDLNVGLPARAPSIESVGSANLSFDVPSCNSKAQVSNDVGVGIPLALPPTDGYREAAACGNPRVCAPATVAVAAAAAAILSAPGPLVVHPVPGATLAAPPLAAPPGWRIATAFGAATPVPRCIAAAATAATAATATIAGGGAAAWVFPDVQELRPLGTAMAGGGSSGAAAAAAPSLLPADVYLGFVVQLVESVRTATRAVDDACRTERQQGGFGGY